MEAEPFKEPLSIRRRYQALFNGPDQNAQRGHESDSQNLAGPYCIPVVGSDDRRVSKVQREHQGFSLSEPQLEVLHETRENLRLPDALNDEMAFQDPLPDKQAIGPV